MKCQKCGAEMVSGHLYCDVCGAEYQIVPDFEPEVDGSILNSLREIQKEAFEEKQDEKSTEQIQTFVLYFLLLILLISSTCICAFHNLHQSACSKSISSKTHKFFCVIE